MVINHHNPIDRLFVTGTDTGVGKTLVAGMLAYLLEAHYWKPIQAGTAPTTDSWTVADWIGKERVFPERYRLAHPMSPNQAARLEGIDLHLDQIHAPETDEKLVVEGAGGLMVPINDKDMILDLIQQLGYPVVLVTLTRLGTLNHTLMSIEMLRARKIPILGVIFNGETHDPNMHDILHFGNVHLIGYLPQLDYVDPDNFHHIARHWRLPETCT